MKKNHIVKSAGRWTVLIVAALAACSCSRQAPAPAEPTVSEAGGTPVIYTVNYPLQYFAQRIGGDHVKVVFPAPADEDPAYWNPNGDAVAAYQEADLILLNGAGYAGWVAKVSLPGSRTVDTTAGQTQALIELEEVVNHTHGPGGAHAHGGLAFTTWLDAELALSQASVIKEALAARWPELSDDFETGFQRLAQDLQALDRALAAAVPADTTTRVVFSHPVYQYLARGYGIEGESVHFEPDAEPSAEMWAGLEALLAEAPAAIMIWEGEPLPGVASRLDALGLVSVVFDPVGNTPEAGDYLSVMQANAERLAAALRP